MTASPTAPRERCPQCSAPLSYDAGKGALLCSHCGAVKTLTIEEGMGTLHREERALHSTLANLEQTAVRGFDVETRSSRCQQCGATVAFPAGSISGHCDFCGGPSVLLPETSVKPLRPTGLIPFRVDQRNAELRFGGWLKGLWFRPSNLAAQARVAKMQGVYVPYWTFDAQVDSSWRADSGTYYWENESYVENGQRKTRSVQKVRWSPARGERHDAYDDFLLCASRGLPRDIARQLGTFDTKTVVPWDARFLLGWHAEEYALGLGEAWNEAEEALRSSQLQRCAGDVPGDTHRNLQATHVFSQETFKHVLLPVWVANYRYGDKVFQFLVNGQTGEVQGKAPWSWVKLAFLALGILLLLLIFASMQR